MTSASSQQLHAQGPEEDRFRGTNGVGIIPTNHLIDEWDDGHEKVEQSYKNASEMGVEWVRIGAPWFSLERERGKIRWDRLDKTVALAHKYNFKVMMQVTTAPTWATGIDQLSPEEREKLPKYDDQYAPTPEHYDSYANFLSEVVKRYAPQGILDYEIWNEPGVVGFWKDSVTNYVVSPESYTELLKRAYPAAHAAHPDVNVIAGGQVVLPTEKSGYSVGAVDFLKRMYAAGAQGYFDSLSHHPYGLGAQKWLWNGWDYMFGDQPTDEAPQESLYSLMQANGDGHKKIWITEVGRFTLEGLEKEGVDPEQEQANVYRRYLKVWEKNPRVGPILFYCLDDKEAPWPKGKPLPEDPRQVEALKEKYFGVVRHDGSWKPAAHAVKDYTQRLAAQKPTPTPSPTQSATPEPSTVEPVPTDGPTATPTDSPTPTPTNSPTPTDAVRPAQAEAACRNGRWVVTVTAPPPPGSSGEDVTLTMDLGACQTNP